MGQCVVTLAQRPELREAVEHLHAQAWPRFLLDGHTPDESGRLWQPLLEDFAQFQVVMLDEAGAPIAAGHTIPLPWDGTVEGLPERGCAGAMVAGFASRGRGANALSALAMAIAPGHRGQGISPRMLEAMRHLAAERGYRGMIAPVRPNWKDRYPLTPIERYVQWQRADGAPFDPWVRTHWKLGAKPLGVAYHSLSIIGTVQEWEQWTGLCFPDSGPYIVPGALVPITIDRGQDQGCYEEPNFWMLHPAQPHYACSAL